MHNDLRGWIARAEKIGKLVRVSGAHLIPFEEKENFPRATGTPAQYLQEVSKKWRRLFEDGK